MQFMTTTGSVKIRAVTLPVVETFHSVQGEGYWTGVSAFFIRLAGCDVGCTWCDTKHSWPVERHPKQAITDLVTEAITARPFMVVITGGEPLMHDLEGLTSALHQAGLRIHLETSGAHPLSGDFDWISLSPKRFKPPLPAIYTQADELKVVIETPSDLRWAEEIAGQIDRGFPAQIKSRHESRNVVKLLQPCWGSENGQALAFDYVRFHPEWRVGLQTHKFLGVR